MKKGSNKKRKKVIDFDEDIVKKKPKVSKAELDLIEELLSAADSAVTESKSAEVSNEVAMLSDATVETVSTSGNNPGVVVDDFTSFFEL